LNSKLPYLIPWLVVLAGIISIAWWVTYDPVKDFISTQPGLDNRGEGVAVNLDINIGEFFESFEEVNSDLIESWPRFRGEHFDNISRSEVSLISKFGSAGPDIK